MTEYSYVVTFKPEGVATDITDFVERIDAIEVGSGEVRNCKLRLNATDGAFITNDDFTGTGKTPLIDQFDKIRVAITDRDSNVYDVIYEVDNLKPVQNAQVGIVLEVELLGQEHWLQRIMFAKPFFQDSGFDVSRIIVESYNLPTSKGSAQADIINHQDTFANGQGNDLPKFTANPYTFIVSEQSCYDALITTLDRMGSSVTAGGAGDFFELGFDDDLTDPNFSTLEFRGFSSGNPPDQSQPIPTIDDSVSVNPGEEEGGLESQRGSVMGTWGADGIGTLPFPNADFIGALEIWNLYKEFDVTVPLYPKDSIVLNLDVLDSLGDFLHHKANVATNQVPPTTEISVGDWDFHSFVNFLITEVDMGVLEYSQWTNNRPNEWKSNGAKTDGLVQQDPPLFNSTLSVWDHNQVVVDGTFRRTWVDAKTDNAAGIPTELLYPGPFPGLVPRGFRVLVFGIGLGPEFAGHDNEVMQFDGTDWRTFRTPVEDNLVGVDNESQIYQFQSGTWTLISDSLTQANDCYHPIFDITRQQGVNSHLNIGGSNFGIISAVEYEFRYRRGDISGGLINSPRYYRMGAWINFRFPFPYNSFNGNTKGNLFGNATGDLEPALLDAGNMHLTSSGKIGFNNDESEDLGPLDALEFATKFEWRYEFDGSGGLVRAGNFACRCAIYDSRDDVAIQDFVIAFNGDWTQTVSLPLTGFKIYRARRPLTFSLETVKSVLFLQELEILNVFEWKNIQKICLVWLGPYDDEGRYAAKTESSFLIPSIEDVATLAVGIAGGPTGLVLAQLFGVPQDFNVKWSIDAFHFTKPGLSLSPPDTTRAIMPRFNDNSQISNKFSLDQSNLANLEIVQFRHVQYEVVTEGLIDLKFGDSFFLQNDELVRERNKNETEPGDNDGIPNTIKLVVKSIRYEITKSPHGPGGFLRYIDGVKRFV